MSNIENKNIITSLDFYFDNKKKGLEQRLKKVKLSKKEEKDIITSKTTKTIRDKVLGLCKVGDIISTILNWNEDVDGELKEAKKEYLLSLYFDKTDQNEVALHKIKQLLTSPQGNTVLSKILRILDNTPPDIELTNHLASVLNNISNSDFINLFHEHKFILNQIELLSPQALTILSDYQNWPQWSAIEIAQDKLKVIGDWSNIFTKEYIQKKQIDINNIYKIEYFVSELIRNKLIEGVMTGNSPNANARLTKIGELILKYIK